MVTSVPPGGTKPHLSLDVIHLYIHSLKTYLFRARSYAQNGRYNDKTEEVTAFPEHEVQWKSQKIKQFSFFLFKNSLSDFLIITVFPLFKTQKVQTNIL